MEPTDTCFINMLVGGEGHCEILTSQGPFKKCLARQQKTMCESRGVCGGMGGEGWVKLHKLKKKYETL